MSDEIIIVSGLPRSGTSMMMKMLQAGGVELLTDGIRTADEDNPKGYFEFEKVKQVKEDRSWMEEARGKAVKIISQLLFDLPSTYRYRVIFVQRRINEILASQKGMLIRRGTFKPDVKDEELRSLFLGHLDRVTAWLKTQENFAVLYVSYNQMLEDPTGKIDEIDRFLGGALDTQAMTGVIDRQLYRQRG